MNNQALIVDSEERTLQRLEDMTTRLGFSPLLARDPKSALQLFHRMHPPIVLTELNLGGDMDGVALCSKILWEDKGVMMIALAESFSEYDRSFCLEAGFSDFLLKPVDINDLFSSLHCAFARRLRWQDLTDKKCAGQAW